MPALGGRMAMNHRRYIGCTALRSGVEEPADVGMTGVSGLVDAAQYTQTQ